MTPRTPVPLAILTVLLILVPATALAGGDWNDGGIAWKSHDEGLALAAASGQPVCIVVYTDWCPHCTNYSKVFHDPQVVERSKRFVMIRVNKTSEPQTSAKYAPDGEYIPRTYFLTPQGALDASIHAPRQKFLYFYDESNPASLLDGMARALEKLAG
jgi:hypothetical protein